ncbi:MFS transporter [Arthrobacter sp. R-11]|uniref:MFS transporter n=1 Tax=Arthrobacter sp. R-11 TaxID=3404053 RepID=UPI003CE9092B
MATNRYSWIAMLLLWLLLAMNDNMRYWTTGVLQPSIVNEFMVGPELIGVFAGTMTVAQGLLAIPLTVWSDRGGHGWARKYRYVIILAAYTVFTLLTGISALTATFAAFFIFQALNKVFSGAGEAIEVTAVAEWWPLEKRGFAVGLHHTAVPWGTFLGGLAVSLVFTIFGPENWRWTLLIPVILIVPTVLAYWKFSSRRNYERFEGSVRSQGGTPPLKGEDEEAVKLSKGALRRAFRNPNLMTTSVVAGLALAVYTGISLWLPLYLAFVANYSLAEVAAFSVLFTLTGGIGQILWGGVSDRIGRKPTLVITFAWVAIGVFLLQFIGEGLIWLILIQLFLGMATNGIYPVLYAFSSDSSEPGAIGLGNGLNMTGQMLGGLGPVVLGILIAAGGGFSSPDGFLWGLYFMAGIMLLGAAAIILFTRESVGSYKKRDRSLVKLDACLPDPRIRHQDLHQQAETAVTAAAGN